MTTRSPKWTHLTTSTSRKHFAPNLERRTAVSLAQPNDIVERSPQRAEKSDLKILHISFYMILGYNDTMDDEGVNSSECSSEEITLGGFHRFRTTFESCTALVTHIAMSPATCPTPTYRVLIAFARRYHKSGCEYRFVFLVLYSL